MSGISGGYSGPREVKYLFIDGGCLRKIIEDISKKYFNGNNVQIDYRKISQGFTKVFYYDSLPPKKPEQTEDDYDMKAKPVQAIFDYLETLDGFHVCRGTLHQRRGVVQQKQVDTMIAVDMLTHSYRRNMHKATLLASDLDFKPLVDALVQDGMFVTLWYGNTENSIANKDLIAAADSRLALGLRQIYGYCTNNFCQNNPIPGIHTSSQKELLLNIIWKDEARRIELAKDGEVYWLIFIEKPEQDSFLHLISDDLDALRFFAKNEYDIDIPMIAGHV